MSVDTALEVSTPHAFADERGINAQGQASAKEVQTFVRGLLHRYEIPFKKIIFVRPIKMLAHELANNSRHQQCKIEQFSNGECYVIISENLLKENSKGFLRGFKTLLDWESSMAFYLLIEIARYKYVQCSQNRCEQWALNELCSGGATHRELVG